MLGFPVALILAWAFELTPEGIKRTEDVKAVSALKPVATGTTPLAVQTTEALRLWKEKLDYLQTQKAMAADAAQRFALEKEIQDASATIARLQRSEHPSTREAPAIPIDISQIDKHAPANLIGRKSEVDTISNAWDQAAADEAGRPYVLTITGMGGQGKSSLVAKWATLQAQQGWPGCDAVLAWSFYTQGTREVAAGSADLFLR